MDKLARRDFFMGLIAVGVAKSLPLPPGLRESPWVEVVPGSEVLYQRWFLVKYNASDQGWRVVTPRDKDYAEVARRHGY